MAEDIWARKPSMEEIMERSRKTSPRFNPDLQYIQEIDDWLSELEALWYNAVSLERYNTMVLRGNNYLKKLKAVKTLINTEAVAEWMPINEDDYYIEDILKGIKKILEDDVEPHGSEQKPSE